MLVGGSSRPGAFPQPGRKTTARAHAEIGAVTQRAGAVPLKKLGADEQRRMKEAMHMETQSWLRSHAAKAARRANYAEKDTMKTRWMEMKSKQEQVNIESQEHMICA